METPQWSALGNLVADLRRTMGNVSELQRAVMRVSGTAWSPDRLVKATVGPRGQLVDLEIDPRVYRTPNSTALAQAIVATVRAATEQAMTEVRRIIDESTPADLRSTPVDGLDLRSLLRRHDADLLRDGLDG